MDHLKGAPGIYSSRFAGDNSTDEENISKLLLALDGIHPSDRSARFQCIIVLIEHANDPTPVIAQGCWEGSVAIQPKGSHGFGYDPIFYLPKFECTSAELEHEVKNKISHRSKAMKELIDKLCLASN